MFFSEHRQSPIQVVTDLE